MRNSVSSVSKENREHENILPNASFFVGEKLEASKVVYKKV